jgi:hypothetical protein
MNGLAALGSDKRNVQFIPAKTVVLKAPGNSITDIFSVFSKGSSSGGGISGGLNSLKTYFIDYALGIGEVIYYVNGAEVPLKTTGAEHRAIEETESKIRLEVHNIYGREVSGRDILIGADSSVWFGENGKPTLKLDLSGPEKKSLKDATEDLRFLKNQVLKENFRRKVIEHKAALLADHPVTVATAAHTASVHALINKLEASQGKYDAVVAKNTERALIGQPALTLPERPLNFSDPAEINTFKGLLSGAAIRDGSGVCTSKVKDISNLYTLFLQINDTPAADVDIDKKSGKAIRRAEKEINGIKARACRYIERNRGRFEAWRAVHIYGQDSEDVEHPTKIISRFERVDINEWKLDNGYLCDLDGDEKVKGPNLLDPTVVYYKANKLFVKETVQIFYKDLYKAFETGDEAVQKAALAKAFTKIKGLWGIKPSDTLFRLGNKDDPAIERMLAKKLAYAIPEPLTKKVFTEFLSDQKVTLEEGELVTIDKIRAQLVRRQSKGEYERKETKKSTIGAGSLMAD